MKSQWSTGSVTALSFSERVVGSPFPAIHWNRSIEYGSLAMIFCEDNLVNK